MFYSGKVVMIWLTRLNGTAFLLNPDLVQSAENVCDSIVTLVTGEKIRVKESLEELQRIITQYQKNRFGHLPIAALSRPPKVKKDKNNSNFPSLNFEPTPHLCQLSFFSLEPLGKD